MGAYRYHQKGIRKKTIDYIIHALTVKTYQERQENYIMYARMQLLISVYYHLIFINDLIYVLTNFASYVTGISAKIISRRQTLTHCSILVNTRSSSQADRVHRQNEFKDGTGNRFLHLQGAMDHKRDNSAVPRLEGTGNGANGQAKPYFTGKCTAQTQEQSLKSRQKSGSSQCS